jgi:hypothetical protein
MSHCPQLPLISKALPEALAEKRGLFRDHFCDQPYPRSRTPGLRPFVNSTPAAISAACILRTDSVATSWRSSSKSATVDSPRAAAEAAVVPNRVVS